MYNLPLGANLPKYNPVYVISDRPNVSLYKPTKTPVIRWDFYKMEFKNIFPHPR